MVLRPNDEWVLQRLVANKVRTVWKKELEPYAGVQVDARLSGMERLAIAVEDAALQVLTCVVTMLGRGEETRENVSIECEYDVFASWWDHLKYEIGNWFGRRGLGQARAYWHKRVIYERKVKTVSKSVIVKVTRVCPHLPVPKNGEEAHFVWLARGSRE